MKADTIIRNEGMEILTKNLDLVEAERFIIAHPKREESFVNHLSVINY